MANQVLAMVSAGGRIEHGRTEPYAWFADGGATRFPDWLARLGRAARATAPRALSDPQAQQFAAARERRMREERLSAALLTDTYQRLFSP